MDRKRKVPYAFTTDYYKKVKRYQQDMQQLSKSLSVSKNSIDATTIGTIPNPTHFENSLLVNANTECALSDNVIDRFHGDVSDSDVILDDYEDESDPENARVLVEDAKVLFIEKLKVWSLSNAITHKALNELLVMLGTIDDMKNYLPKDSRTLLQTPREVRIISMGPDPTGKFWYNGVQVCLENVLSANDDISLEKLYSALPLELTFNIDGLPIANSSKYEFWPILASIHNLPSLQKPMIIAIYYGTCKPNLQLYFEQFIEELNKLLQHGFVYNNHHITIKIRMFICDSPARAFVKGTVNFNHRHGCSKCTTEGEYYINGHHMSFSILNAPLRNDYSFRHKLDEDHHKETSPLERLPLDLVDDFPVADSLHLLHLGIMRKCLLGWVHGSYNFKTKLSGRQISEISELLQKSNHTLPSEIHRAVRKLDCLKFWKGTEFRTVLMYLGPVIFKDFLEPVVYEHFMILFCAVTICSCKEYFQHLDVAQMLFDDYIKTYIKIYGIDSVSSNVHNLHHVVKDIKRFGPLIDISTYRFENELYRIKHLLRSGNKPLAQVANRLGEFYGSKIKATPTINSDKTHISAVVSNHRGPTSSIHSLQNCAGVYNKVYLENKGFILKNDNRNKWFLTKNMEIVEMVNATYFEDNIVIFGRSLKQKHIFFNKPFNSNYLNIFSSSCSGFHECTLYNLSNVKSKLVSLHFHNQTVFLPLLHTY